MNDKVSPIPILAPESIRRRRRLSLTAFLLGLGAVILSLVVVVISQLRNREEIEREYLRRTRDELSLLCSALDDPLEKSKDDEVLLNVLCDRWRQMGHWGHDPDEHFIVVNNVDSEVLLDTIYRGWLHHPEKSMGLLQVVLNIREQQRRNFSDTFKTDSGEALLGTFRNTDPTRQKARNWLLGIYRSAPVCRHRKASSACSAH